MQNPPTPDTAPRKLDQVIAALGLQPDDVEPHGWFKGKLALGLERRLPERHGVKYLGVTAISPTPLGEGKTVVAIGLAMALCRLGRPAIVTLRQPSQGPVFGIKGGGAGGGRAFLVPSEDINLHFTGDLHAVTAANNLLAAMIDNHVRRGATPVLDPATVTWRRVLDVNDASLRRILTSADDLRQPPRHETGFDLTAASEVMAILALATSLDDLRRRLGRILVGLSPTGQPVFADDLHAAGAMAALLKDAVRPNLVQTCEHTPALVHAGPFANIAPGNSSVLADLSAVRLADYVVTESGFGADLGAEKFFDIKCRLSGLVPSAQVLVCTVRGLKLQSGRFKVQPGKPLPADLSTKDLDALQAGTVNLQAHLDILRLFGVPVVVAINRFPSDSDRELDVVLRFARHAGADAAVITDAYTHGSAGAVDLAEAIVAVSRQESRFDFLYPLDLAPEEKIAILARRVYGAEGVDYEPTARQQMDLIRILGFNSLPVCIAKTQYSLSHDPHLLGRPQGYRFPIREVRLAAGAGFLYALAGDIQLMPGLPSVPAATRIDVNADGTIRGIS
jgi:formate--tetrahydrofolate ligase